VCVIIGVYYVPMCVHVAVPKEGVKVEIGVKLYRMSCANFLDMPVTKGVVRPGGQPCAHFE